MWHLGMSCVYWKSMVKSSFLISNCILYQANQYQGCGEVIAAPQCPLFTHTYSSHTGGHHAVQQYGHYTVAVFMAGSAFQVDACAGNGYGTP